MFSGFPPALIYNFSPFGNAYYNTTQCGQSSYSKDAMFCWVKQCNVKSPPAECFAGEPLCQHGPAECKANLVEACAKYLYPDPSMYSPFVTCFEGEHQADPTYLGPCARYYNLDDTQISACAANSTLAAELTVRSAKETLALGSDKLGTPWVMLNGENVPNKDLPLLLELVCEQFDPTAQPEGCQPGARAREANATKARAALC